MSLFDFFFPQQAQAQQLRRLASGQQASSRRRSRTDARLEARMANLEDDLGYVTLILGSILNTLDEKGLVTRSDVKSALASLDELDGVADGRLDINILRGQQS